MKFADIRVWLASHVVKSTAQRNFLKQKALNQASKLTLAISHFASGLHQTASANFYCMHFSATRTSALKQGGDFWTTLWDKIFKLVEIFVVASLEWENVISFSWFSYFTPRTWVLSFSMLCYMNIQEYFLTHPLKILHSKKWKKYLWFYSCPLRRTLKEQKKITKMKYRTKNGSKNVI